MNKLQEVLPHILKHPEKLNLILKKLSRKEKQLLCLVKASLKKEAKLVIIECPEQEIQETVNLHIKKDFYQKTIIIIGSNHLHFECCNRLIDFDSSDYQKK